MLVEVLSPSTVDYDRGRKAYDYRRIPSVQEIVLVASEQRHIVIWRRRGAKWEVEDLIGDAALELETVGVENSVRRNLRRQRRLIRRGR